MKVAKTVKIRDVGHDEYWLQDVIYEDPTILGLGELESVSRERTQSSGGRLDLLLKSPEDNAMYEVEVMLGQTDESHIVRAIEYWDIERKRWPKRQHSCVLVAEVINRRFFNVIQLLSNSIPIIAIQASVIDTGTERILHFTKILDVYEEPEYEEPVASEDYNEVYWKKVDPDTVIVANSILDIAKKIDSEASLGFVKNYISVSYSGKQRVWLRGRGKDETLFTTWLEDGDFHKVEEELARVAVKYSVKNGDVMFKTSNIMVKNETTFFQKLLELQRNY